VVRPASFSTDVRTSERLDRRFHKPLKNASESGYSVA
jgi:hypothetical protein